MTEVFEGQLAEELETTERKKVSDSTSIIMIVITIGHPTFSSFRYRSSFQ